MAPAAEVPAQGGYPAAAAAALDSQHVAELRRRAAALRSELLQLESAIEAEEAMIGTAPEVPLHHRPSYSLMAGEQEEPTSPSFVRQVSPQDWDAVLSKYPKMVVSPIGSFNHWDRRECAVANADEWKAACTKYQKEVLKGDAKIPKVIHQIWIGPREPPCLWLDTFRVEYLSAHPEWGFKLWSDEEVKDLPMINEQMYREEKMWQCKADILRLEHLWHHGGLYVDADMISVENKSLDIILELGKETGWVIAYEPDTKDKPYSILGNSVIACTPHHPLTLMLILYLKETYAPKRHHIDVFMVTGPVMYTKCLVDSGMPISVAAQELLYPAFHFVPNPDAINFSAFPKCLMFQFGYTCSGLEGYVKSKNRCKKARECPFHSKKAWPMGPFRDLIQPTELSSVFAKKKAPIPRVIHQLVLCDLDSVHDPVRWRASWFDAFKQKHPEFEYRTWTRQQLEGRPWFCANLYVPPFDDHAATTIMMEILFEEGGFYVPLSTLYQPDHGQDSFFLKATAANAPDFAEGNGGVIGAAKSSPQCYQQILSLYDKGCVPRMSPPDPNGARVLQMGFRDGTVSKARFSKNVLPLGVSQIVAFSAAADEKLEIGILSMAYEAQATCLAVSGVPAMKAAVADAGICDKALFVTSHEYFSMHRIRKELPNLLQQLGSSGWDAALVGLEWSTGSEEVVVFPLVVGGKPKNCKVTGFIANFGSASHPAELRSMLQKCVTDVGFDPEPFFNAAGGLQLRFCAEKYPSTLEEARIFQWMPAVHHAFTRMAGHEPAMNFDRHEIHGNLLKGFHDGRTKVEMILEPNGGCMFRCWNDDSSTNCEVKMTTSVVEWMKIYHNHQVAKEIMNEPVP